MKKPSKNGVLDLPELVRPDVAEVAQYTRNEAMMLVGMYYGIQKLRVGASNKASAHKREVDDLSDPALILAMKGELRKLEKWEARALQTYAEAQPLGRWAMSQTGVGPVICAGLLAHIDVTRSNSVAGVWRFAGLDPDMVWEKGQKRPYNAALKTICWKLGESFKKAPGHTRKDKKTGRKVVMRDYSLYERLYRDRKKLEVRNNNKGLLAGQAAQKLASAAAKKARLSPEQKKTWQSGKLQDVGLDRRAMRYAVKIFLSHFWQVGRELLGLPGARPYAIAYLGHVDEIAIPNWPMAEED